MRYITTLVLFICCSYLFGQSVQSSIDALVKMPALKHASVSVHVQDMQEGKTIASHDKNLSLIPASSLKLITTGVALEKLGSNYTYETKILVDNQNVYLLGSGDPSLGAPKSDYTDKTSTLMLKFADAVAKTGVRQYSGGVVAISDVFDTAPVGDSWPYYDLGNYYASGVWGLNVRENYYDLFLDQNTKKGGTPSCCGTDPEIPGLRFINELTSGSSTSGDNAYIYGGPYGYQKFIRGSIPSGTSTFKIKGSMPEPPLVAAQLLHKAIEERNINISQSPAYTFQAPSLSSAREVYIHRSPILEDIITETNRKSINLYAEALLKTIAMVENGKPGSTKNGVSVIYNHLQSKGISTDGLYMVDGSGMSPRNGISSKQFTDYLYSIFKQNDIYPTYKNSLAIIGRQGTLQYMMKKSPIAGHLYGKSGSMERVRSYTGYIETQSGRTIAFSVIINNYAGKSRTIVREIEKIFSSIYAL